MSVEQLGLAMLMLLCLLAVPVVVLGVAWLVHEALP